MHQNRQSYDTKFITVQIVPVINNGPPLKGVISQRLGMNFIKTAMSLYLLSFWKANFFPIYLIPKKWFSFVIQDYI